MFRLKTNKSHRRKHLASELIKLAIDKYEHRGITLRACHQEGGPSNTSLIKMYRKLGFKRKGTSKVMYLDPPKKIKSRDKIKIPCPNCGNKMVVTPMSYWRHYRHGYDDMADCSNLDYDSKALQCKNCKLSYAGEHVITYKNFSINHWDSSYTLYNWLNDINHGKGKNWINYD